MGCMVLSSGEQMAQRHADGKDINPAQPVLTRFLSGSLINVNGTLYFGRTSIHGGELWKSDGTNRHGNVRRSTRLANVYR
jgi:hypothetical protein